MLLPDVYVLLVEIFESYLNGFVGFVILFFFFLMESLMIFMCLLEKRSKNRQKMGYSYFCLPC